MLSMYAHSLPNVKNERCSATYLKFFFPFFSPTDVTVKNNSLIVEKRLQTTESLRQIKQSYWVKISVKLLAIMTSGRACAVDYLLRNWRAGGRLASSHVEVVMTKRSMSILLQVQTTIKAGLGWLVVRKVATFFPEVRGSSGFRPL